MDGRKGVDIIADAIHWIGGAWTSSSTQSMLAELATASRHFLNPYSFHQLAGAAANQCALEAMESEKIAHIDGHGFDQGGGLARRSPSPPACSCIASWQGRSQDVDIEGAGSSSVQK
jgi:hypothetical protein